MQTRMQTLEDRVLSDENIFLSIYLADSYLQNKELLSAEERSKLVLLKDVFRTDRIENTISEVNNRLNLILHDDSEYFDTTVYFKPKKFKEGSTVFRPLHTASLIDQIAMIAMLQVLVYDIDDKSGKLIPSEISRLLPSNFYGNRIAFDGTKLFKPWQEQYQAYTARANEMLYSFSETMEYKYEVSLDLENFFPSIDPRVLYKFILSHLPLKLNSEDRKLLEVIIRKLLIFRLCDLNEEETEWYLGRPLSTTENHKDICYAKGLPQGLPHTYFMANLFMLIVKDKYFEFFPGEMLFYVDDSVIFTNGDRNGLDNDEFNFAIQELNKRLKNEEKRILDKETVNIEGFLPSDYCYSDKEYGVSVHDLDSKSAFAPVMEARKNSGEMYLKSLSRETSNISFDMHTMFSEEEVEMISGRTKAILDAIESELEKITKGQTSDDVYKDKLVRYRKFFHYRSTILKYRCTGDINKLAKKIIEVIALREDSSKIKEFMDEYTDDILAAAISFVLKRYESEAIKTEDYQNLIEAIKELCSTLYKENPKHSYIRKAYEQYLDGKEPSQYEESAMYDSLKKAVMYRYRAFPQQTSDIRRKQFANDSEICDSAETKTIFVMLNLSEVYAYSEYVRANSANLERMILNAMFSYLFEYSIDDRFIFSKNSRSPIQYSEVRILAILRNRDFSLDGFNKKYKDCIKDEFLQTVDYSLLQVLPIFKTFVKQSAWIDDLILIHKYCCDTWKNGSKYLHFYTLHNQEHAISLIRSSVQLLHAISYFKIKKLDYYILFAACYLHDISMVSLPDASTFYVGNNEYANCIYSECMERLRDNKGSAADKKALYDAYREIDGFFESDIRNNHASNSAKEIRRFRELDFLDAPTRELIAQVSACHGNDCADIYFGKSFGKSALVNEKFIKIILRLSDLLDMSRYRISNVILNHNLLNLNEVSRFHWISHLITNGCSLDIKYDSQKSSGSSANGTFLEKKSIVERLVLTVDVLMSQTTEVENAKKCNHVLSSAFYKETDADFIRISCDKDSNCTNSQCNFLCKWFVTKNNYLLEELSALKEYLNSIPDNFFACSIEINIKVVANTNIPNDIFDCLREYVEKS